MLAERGAQQLRAGGAMLGGMRRDVKHRMRQTEEHTVQRYEYKIGSSGASCQWGIRRIERSL